MRMAEAYTALWWTLAGHTLTTADAEGRVLHLRGRRRTRSRRGALPAAGRRGLRPTPQPARLDLSCLT